MRASAPVPFHRGRSTLVLCLLGAMSCSNVTGSDDRVSAVAILQHYESPPRVELPVIATAGDPFEVVIETYGELNCILAGETKVRHLDDRRVEITAFDVFLIPGPGSACTLRPVPRRHAVRIFFDSPGDARILIRGRAYAGGFPWQSGDLVELEFPVTITVD